MKICKISWLIVAATGVAVVVATGAFGGSGRTAAAVKPTLAVVVVGKGRVTSTPAGISCPGKCSATFAKGTRVALAAKASSRSRFLRWGGNCTGRGACRVRVTTLSAVAAQFVGGSSTQPPPPAATSVEPGTYSYGSYFSFFVPAGAKSVQTFSYSNVRVECAGGGSYSIPLNVLTTAIKGDRSFTARTSQSGVVGGANAMINPSVTGRFQGRDSQGRATASGIYRVDLVFADTPSRKCTSNDAPWTATRYLPPPTGPVEPGTYSYGSYFSFFVPAGAKSVQTFSYSNVRVECAGGGSYSIPLKILTAAIQGDRSFTAKTSQSGVVSGASATTTTAVTGYFQGPNSQGRATASGIYRVDIVFASTPSRKCTTNDLPWTAARTG